MTPRTGFALVLALGLAAAPPPATALESSRALASALASGKRAEAVLRWTVPGPDGRPAEQRGTLALEAPAHARLDVPATGERITLRPDGGEWLQPALHQMIRLSPRHAGSAMRWWRLLAGGEGARERRLAEGRWRLVLVDTSGAAVDSAEVRLDPRGLPASLVLGTGEDRQVYRLSGWRFARARGARDFRIVPPPGVEAVELP